ncbi:MAG: hypothetical protein ACI8WM_000137 [Burkholderiaceae bacterium]|jgi:hypothetical protein
MGAWCESEGDWYITKWIKGKKQENNQVSAHGVRLVVSSIVAYNTIILNPVYERTIAVGIN